MSYLEYFSKPIDETIRARVSCRTYDDRLLDEKDKKELLNFCEMASAGFMGEKIEYRIVEFTREELKDKEVSAYGLIKNARSFVFGTIDTSDSHPMSYGYALEHIVLKATELGLGTCWAGYFDPYVIRDAKMNENQTVPAVIIIGYASSKKTFRDRAARLAIAAARRYDWGRIFFYVNFEQKLNLEAAGPYREPLELLRLAPSSGNTQPWRIVKERDRRIYHIFKKAVNPRYEKRKLHDMDIGIAMCHFELGAAKKGLKGTWIHEDPNIADLPAKITYMISWIDA